MYLPKTSIQDLFGCAYIRSIIARSGFGFSCEERDYGIDGMIAGYKKRNGQIRSRGHYLTFQLKSTYNYVIENEVVKYDLEIKNYTDLIDEDIDAQRILILVLLPKETQEWLEITPSFSTLRHCAVWGSLRGLPDVSNNQKKRILINEKDIFDMDAVTCLMNRISGGDIIEKTVCI